MNQEVVDIIKDNFLSDFKDIMTRRIGYETESKRKNNPWLVSYLKDELQSEFEDMGFDCELWWHEQRPFLFACRFEGNDLPTVLGYGHGDVVNGNEEEWSEGLSPWKLHVDGDTWYGRGIADNKGQHSINMLALRYILKTKGNLGFNCKYLIEMGEEIGSPGLEAICEEKNTRLSADVFVGSDGPRFAKDAPTIFLGCRGALIIRLRVDAREGGRHSGNWGGVLANPAVQLSHAIAMIISETGRLRIPGWIPPDGVAEDVRNLLKNCDLADMDEENEIDYGWGETNICPAERLYGWSDFQVLTLKAGNVDNPVNAIPPFAEALCQIRFTSEVDDDKLIKHLEGHLRRYGLEMVKILPTDFKMFKATRTLASNPWVKVIGDAVENATEKRVTVLPSLGGSAPNDVFLDILKLPTIWIPHSYPGCKQHAADEHLPIGLLEEAMMIMLEVYSTFGRMGRAKTGEYIQTL